jgi:hypothetical protein
MRLRLAVLPLALAAALSLSPARASQNDCASSLEPDFRALTGLVYSKVRMLEKYQGENEGRWIQNGDSEEYWNVRYLGEDERDPYRLVFRAGRVFNGLGRPIRISGILIFVMDGFGNIYAAENPKVGQHHHTSFLAGRGVAGAGELAFLQGRPFARNRRSGHYYPPFWTDKQVARELIDRGVASPASLLEEDPGWDVFIGLDDGRLYSREEILRLIEEDRRRAA